MIEIIKAKLATYQAINALEEENALKEIIQEIALYGLWRGDFFDCALFQGGTSLRILYGLPRFSEDLDFILRKPDNNFDWQKYSTTLTETFEMFGIKLEVLTKSQMDLSIKQALLKSDSIAKQLSLTFPNNSRQKMHKIKLEIDANPPFGSNEETSFLDFPLDFEVRHQDLASNFALKCHALFCREYLKGRDWFDFAWYVAREISPNIELLNCALRQSGPWKDSELQIDFPWLNHQLELKIKSIDWQIAAKDVERFLRSQDRRTLELWKTEFFISKLKKLSAYF